MRHFFRSSLAIVAILSACMAVPVPAQAEPVPIAAAAAFMVSPHPVMDSMAVSTQVSAVAMANAFELALTNVKLALDVPRRIVAGSRISVPTLRAALSTSRARTGRLFRDAPNRQDRRDLLST